VSEKNVAETGHTTERIPRLHHQPIIALESAGGSDSCFAREL